MVRAQRAVALVTLALLNVFTIAAGAAVIMLGPEAGLPIGPRVLHPPPTTPKAPVLSGLRGGAAPDPQVLSQRLAKPAAARALGRLGAVVIDPATGKTLYDQDSQVGMTPASTTKLATSLAALSAAGPDHTIATRVVQGANKSSIVLVGGGDPELTTARQHATDYPKMASLADLAAKTAAKLRASGVTKVMLRFDDSAYSGPRTAPGWKPNYIPEGNVAPVSALEVDEGRVSNVDDGTDHGARVSDPPRVATQRFAQALRHRGIRVGASTGRVHAAQNAAELARVESPPLSALVEHALTVSDNDMAEALARQVAIARGRPASFSGAAQAVTDELGRLGITDGVRLSDNSGLSTRNRISPAALAKVLSIAASRGHDKLRAVLTGLPIGGFSGTLAHRYTSGMSADAAGDVRAKTGTLNGVSTLAGVAYDADGRLLVYAFMAGKFGGGLPAAELALDRLAATVAGCGCN
ncbi:MAG TPA: D-alanyl-D-alanine carboxypeptidase/D-alanyl-D-alanine-endopeptidase [Streptosporangiaceae bacterium]|jgi:D-alanyl-D-alanine carboxypeptidase/D-alanyl-D-alanine-endopeptidase (penicillin-binding protein 4)